MTVTREYPGVFSNSHSSRKTYFLEDKKNGEGKGGLFLEKKNVFFLRRKREGKEVKYLEKENSL